MSRELEAEIVRLRKEVARLELIICQRNYNSAPENARLSALEEAARECEKISGQTTNGSRATIECAYGQTLAARIRALKGESNA